MFCQATFFLAACAASIDPKKKAKKKVFSIVKIINIFHKYALAISLLRTDF